ncbi:MAG: DUF484 family protein [Pseudomonadales bacterium]|jgi:hypothetical protein|nr:DUF484 family protein [Pseudomonadales bacterium]MDP6469879.1 DUF484 family protein [Pseudomonadales bacterium]MDP6827518.1 DUF484 family protein [Pseudomonadales bacterium]MDP6971349.1 DUF484 family protein [Pseudomonadales bacterium]|tara:strand:- start:217 stop:879 length:663 start_codon:yes stop_codon:yes gene_type:complete
MSDSGLGEPLSHEQVVEFLREYPDFFLGHSSLLSELKLPHDSGSAVSLIERQVAVLRERNIQMRRRMNDLLQTARDNDELFAKTRSLTLALLDVRDLHDLNEVLATSVLVDFDADFVCCHMRGDGVRYDHLIEHSGPMPHENFVRNLPLCTTLRPEELDRLFPVQQHESDGSVVLVPLNTTSIDGCLAIGSRDPARFTADMDTLFVTYICDVLCRVIGRL